jgi:hypothetical protein
MDTLPPRRDLVISLPADEADAVEAMAAKAGISVSELVRRAIEWFDPDVDPDMVEALREALEDQVADNEKVLVRLRDELAAYRAERAERERLDADRHRASA